LAYRMSRERRLNAVFLLSLVFFSLTIAQDDLQTEEPDEEAQPMPLSLGEIEDDGTDTAALARK